MNATSNLVYGTVLCPFHSFISFMDVVQIMKGHNPQTDSVRYFIDIRSKQISPNIKGSIYCEYNTYAQHTWQHNIKASKLTVLRMAPPSGALLKEKLVPSISPDPLPCQTMKKSCIQWFVYSIICSWFWHYNSELKHSSTLKSFVLLQANDTGHDNMVFMKLHIASPRIHATTLHTCWNQSCFQKHVSCSNARCFGCRH